MSAEILLSIIVVALAAHRAARALSTDTITDRLRGYVYDRAFTHPALDPAGPDEWTAQADYEAGIIPPPEERVAPERQTTSVVWAYLYGLLSCPHCCGFWISIGLWALWRNVDDLRVWIAAGAVAGLQSAISARAMVGGGDA